jgi:NAD(P)-dependent dehydrogenase (short-subunit alcohol dehydrogenase family)
MRALTAGANVGLGLEAAKHLARFNPHKLILACRNQEKGDRAVRYITETTSVAAGIVECWELDLASFDSVKAFAKRGSLSARGWLVDA